MPGFSYPQRINDMLMVKSSVNKCSKERGNLHSSRNGDRMKTFVQRLAEWTQHPVVWFVFTTKGSSLTNRLLKVRCVSNWILMSCPSHGTNELCNKWTHISHLFSCVNTYSSQRIKHYIYWAIQAELLTPLTFARHRLSPLAAFTSGAYFLHNGRRWQWIWEFYTASFKGIFGSP